MNKLKLYALTALILPLAYTARAQDTTRSAPNTRLSNNQVFTAIETEPRFNGNFGGFLGKNIKYPELDWLSNTTGRVFIQFIVEKDGRVSNVKVLRAPDSTLAAEAVRVISMSPPWSPGIQNSKPVRVMYTVPINFTFENTPAKFPIDNLHKSRYGFVFSIDGQLYSLDEAKEKLGGWYDRTRVESIKQYNDPKYAIPGKKAMYLITIKNS